MLKTVVPVNIFQDTLNRELKKNHNLFEIVKLFVKKDLSLD